MTIEAAIAGEQARGLGLGVSAYQEIRKNSRAWAALFPVYTPSPAGRKKRQLCRRLNPDLVCSQEIVALLLRQEVDTRLGIDDITDDQ